HHRIGRRAADGKAPVVVLPEAHRGRQGQRVARARLLLDGGDDPHVIAELARDRLEQLQPARIHAVVVGDQDAHMRSYAGLAAMLQPPFPSVSSRSRDGAEERQNAPYSQQLGDLFTAPSSVLVKESLPKYRPGWGMADLTGKSRESQQ